MGKTIRALRIGKGWTLEKLEELSGVASGTIHAIEKRDSSRSEFFPDLAKAFGMTVEQLQNHGRPPVAREPQPEYAGTMNNVRRITVVGTARLAEGLEGFYEEISSVPGAGDGHIDIASADPDAYGLRVRGSSMAPAIRDGWYVLVEPNARPAVGEYVLVKLHNGQKMVKELLYQRPDSIEVLSVNSGLRRTIYMEELESIQPVAAVVSPSKWKPD